MKMIYQTQDKQSIVEVEFKEIYVIPDVYCGIYTLNNKDEECTLATYSTCKQALDVMEKIKRYINCNLFERNNNVFIPNDYGKVFVFEEDNPNYSVEK